jgi:hypothetical protein
MFTGIDKENTDDVGGDIVTQPRLVIPHFFGGVLRGWSKRKLENWQLGPKYKHSHQFPKATTLYNWDNVTGFDTVILVESPMSVLKLKSEGIPNVVASFGADVNEGQADLLTHFKEVILFPDGDRAGYKALRHFDKRGQAQGTIAMLSNRTYLSVIDHGLVDGKFNEKDAADYSGDELQVLVEGRIPAMVWKWRDDGIRKASKSEVVFIGGILASRGSADGEWD